MSRPYQEIIAWGIGDFPDAWKYVGRSPALFSSIRVSELITTWSVFTRAVLFPQCAFRWLKVPIHIEQALSFI
jgi:hypothetical protein